MSKLDKKYAENVLKGCLQALSPVKIDRLEDCIGIPFPDVSMPTSAFRGQYLAYNLVRKYTGLDLGLDTEEVARATFYENERICSHINGSRGVSQTSNRHKRRIGERALFYAIRKIGQMCGTLDLVNLFSHCNFTNGASLQRRRTCSQAENKWTDRCDVTRDASGLFQLVFKTQAIVPFQGVNLVEASRGGYVDKDARTKRFISIEPQGNMFLQRSIGKTLRRTLLSVGIDLRDQSRNAALSRDLRWATIDLSSASDRISSSSVRLLLQQAPALLEALEMTRTPALSLDGKVLDLEKFSGMGNGFTFELESLIFYALSYGACRASLEAGVRSDVTQVLVYGDDIIVPREHYWTVLQTLKYMGFSPNTLKSYGSGPFRESCGAHWHDGSDCTPFYVKDLRFDCIGDFYHLANGLNAMLQVHWNDHINRLLLNLHKRLKANNLLLFVPPSFSTRSGVHGTFDIAVPQAVRRYRKTQIEGLTLRVLVDVTRNSRLDELGSYAVTLSKEHLPTKGTKVHPWLLKVLGSTAPAVLPERSGGGMWVKERFCDRVVKHWSWDTHFTLFGIGSETL